MMYRLLLSLALLTGYFQGCPPLARAQCYRPTYSHSYGCAPSYSYGSHYSSNYCAPCTPRYYNTCSLWQYVCWPGNHNLYTRYRTCYDHCGVARTEYDQEWLHERYWHCGRWCYRPHCLLSAYSSPLPLLSPSPYIDPRGQTEFGYRTDQYDFAKRFSYATQPGVLAQQPSPRAVDPSALIADLSGEKYGDHAERMTRSMAELGARMIAKGQEIEHEKVKGRNDLTRQVQADNATIQKLGKILEVLAVMDRAAVVDANAAARSGAGISFSTSSVKNPKLAELLNERCVKCHGATKQAGELDLRNHESFKVETWKLIRRKCEEKEMPQEGEPLTEDEQDLLDEQVDFAKSKA